MSAATLRRPLRVRAFTLIEMVIVIAILGILAAIVIPRFSSAQDVSTHTAAEQTVAAVQRKIQEQQAKTGDWPSDIDPNWFTPVGVPENPYLGEPASIVVQNDADKFELKYKHTNKGPIIWWYNRANGMFHTRVPWQGTDAATLELYNRVNQIKAVNN
ncbi:MAG: type II secretion system protein [Planctomycetota bacterium]